jgi:hypothetical protein
VTRSQTIIVGSKYVGNVSFSPIVAVVQVHIYNES